MEVAEGDGRDQRVQKRVANACRYCKKRKVKCSGSAPCVTCSRRKIPCIFEDAGKKVLVSESYLLELERGRNGTPHSPAQESAIGASQTPRSTNYNRARELQRTEQESNDEQVQSALAEPGSPHGQDPITNPLVSQTSAYVRDSVGRYRFLGPSSTWTFSQRVFLHLKEALPENQSSQVPLNVDGTAYELVYTNLDSNAPLDTSELPSIDYTLYLMNTVKFYTCQMFRPFDEEEFTRNLYEFHEQGRSKIHASRLWFVQFLLIVALGKAMVVVVKDPTTAPGSAWFQRAMSIMPDFIHLQREPSLAIQVLCLVALYLVSVDMKEAAYAYIGQAVRICLVEGLHRETPRQVLGDRLANHYRDIWWTVYILDRRLSSMLGAPSSIQDADITCPLPAVDDRSQRGSVLNIHVKISRVMAQILNSVYSVERLSRPFVKIVQAVLRDLAAMAQEIDDVFTSAAYGSVGAISTVAGHINLSYHQCILLATRPLLLHLLIALLKGTLSSHDSEKTLRPQTKDLLETCLQSARMILKILLTLYEHHLLDSFLPFDLESVFSAAFIMKVASAIVPSMTADAATYRAISDRVVDYLIRKGSIPAQLRKKELLCLDQMIEPVISARAPGLPRPPHSNDHSHYSATPNFAVLGGWSAGPGESGLNPSQMLNIADQLETQAFSSGAIDIDTDWAKTSPWAWWFELQTEHHESQPL